MLLKILFLIIVLLITALEILKLPIEKFCTDSPENAVINIIGWYGRTGNRIISLAHGIYWAKTTSSIIIFPRDAFLGGPHTFDFRKNKNSVSKKIDVGCDIVFYCKNNKYLTENDKFIKHSSILKEYVSKLLPPVCWQPVDYLDSNTLVIHIRSGDIIDGTVWYLQPPLFYYEYIISKYGYKKIVIVTEMDKKNPCINELQKKYKCRVETNSLIEDFRILLNATNLVIGHGTFCYPIILMSKNLKNLYKQYYIYPEMKIEGINIINILFDREKYKAEAQRTKNLEEYKKVMLDFKSEISTL